MEYGYEGDRDTAQTVQIMAVKAGFSGPHSDRRRGGGR
ncbi:acyltransferase 3 domain protein [Mycobacterium ulcerans str. Harvey]|uniref:Acyltransferase 3 domain protein n=1 Tax=Mycobacterium ulcerans str. Harvey TaxID=1299332 RepID=A0ABP3AI65_MYCUL|nr:acyltransferase 3 domain protein [Mycobacterium ulcerans str. Harvey]